MKSPTPNRTPDPFRGARTALSSAAGLTDQGNLALVAIGRTQMPMIIADAGLYDTPIVMANAAFLNLCGYRADEVIGRNCRFLQGPDTDKATLQRIRHEVSVATREFTVELLNYRKDGSPYWVQLRISPVRNDDGELRYFFASQLDVTRQREAVRLEASERRLLREVDHRAKNALALVQGIVRLSRADDAIAYAEAVQRRVDALAHAHTLLSESSWRAVSLGRLLQAEIAPFGSRRVSLGGPEIDVAADQVQPLALLLHELVANAAEHGALSADGGTLAIDWWRAGGATIVRLVETGGPPPAAGRAPGFGMKMVDAFVRRQLCGEVAYAWHATGLETELTIPAGLTRGG